MGSKRGRRGNGAQLYAQPAADEPDIEAVDEPEVDIIDALPDPSQDEVEVAIEGQHAEPEEKRDAFADLQRQHREAIAAREEANRRADDAARAHDAQRSETIEWQRSAIKGELDRQNHNLETARANLRAAIAANDAEGIALANEAMADAKVELRELTRGSEAFEAKVAQEEARRKQPRQQSAQPTAEQWSAFVDREIQQFTPATQDFARKHRDVIYKDAKSRQAALAAHTVATSRGIAEDTPEYFSFISQSLGIEDQPQKAEPRRAPTSQRPVMAAAPVSRAGSNSAGRLTLTREQADAAVRMGMTPSRYALHLETMRKGASDPNYTGPRLTSDTGMRK